MLFQQVAGLIRATVAVVTVSFVPLVASADELADDIIGLWDTRDGAHVEIYEREGQYYGKFVWFYDEPPAGGIDAENPDPELRGRSLLGTDFILRFEFDGKKWKNGRMYNPENGKEYKADVELKNGVLRVRGWVGIRLLGRTVEWVRISS